MARKRLKAQTRAERNIAWIEEYCYIPEGKFVGKLVTLAQWQKDALAKIYDNPHGTRLAIISFAKKNAKTTMAAFLLLLHLCGPEAVQNTQLPSTAQSKEQAAVLFSLASKMVRMCPALSEVVTIRESGKQLFCPELGTVYRALSADANTAHGQSPIFAVHDELGQVKGPVSELYDAIESAMGAHEAPLSIVISTQAPTDADLLSVLIDDGRSGGNPHTVVIVYSADESLDPFSDEALRQANPAMGTFLSATELRSRAENARRIPSQEALYRNYNLNQRVEVSSPFINRSLWKECEGDALASLDGMAVYGGLDLSEVSDLTACVLIGAHDQKWHIRPTFWLPAEGLREKSRKDRVPYDQWASEGFLETTPGRSIEYEYVAGWLRRLFDRCDVRQMAFDRWNWRHLRPWLEKAGFGEGELGRFVEFGQGFASMSPALRDLESLILNGRIVHDGHPVLTMCMANAVVQGDPSGNRKLAKHKSAGRIDGAVALAMAAAVAATEDITGPVEIEYASGGLFL